MGVGDFIYLLSDTVKSCTPDLTPVYDYSRIVVTKVDNAVRVDVGQKLTECLPDVERCAKIGKKLTGYMPDAERCAKIGKKLTGYLPDDEGGEKIEQLAWNIGKNAVVLSMQEAAKLVPVKCAEPLPKTGQVFSSSISLC